MNLPVVVDPPQRILLDAGPSGEGWSSLESFNVCERFYYYRHVEKLEEDVEAPLTRFNRSTGDYEAIDPSPLMYADGPLTRGSLGHIGLAHYYRRRMAVERGEDPERWLNPEEAMALWSVTHHVHPELRALIPMVVNKYVEWAESGGDSIIARIVDVEQRFVATLTDRKGRVWRRTQRFDLTFEDHAGMIWTLDHKFVFRPSKSTHERYQLSGQFLLARKFGPELHGDRYGGVLINQVGVDPDTLKIHRDTLEPAPFALQTFVDTTGELLARIKELRERNDFLSWIPAYNEKICIGPYKTDGTFRCPFFTRCQWG